MYYKQPGLGYQGLAPQKQQQWGSGNREAESPRWNEPFLPSGTTQKSEQEQIHPACPENQEESEGHSLILFFPPRKMQQ